MKSVVMGVFMISIALGNFLTAIISATIGQIDQSHYSPWTLGVGAKSLDTGTPLYFFFYAGLMLMTALLFLLVVKNYKYKTYLHNEE